MKIEKGIYIRTDWGICKVESAELYKTKDKLRIIVDKPAPSLSYQIREESIKNSNYNIIDLIGYMDLIYINKPIKVYNHRGEEHIMGFFNPLRCDGWNEDYIILNMDWLAKKEDIKNEDISFIITNEQIIKYGYKVGK